MARAGRPVGEAYAKKQAEFKSAIWELYPGMEDHFNWVFSDDLEPLSYNSKGYPVADGGNMDVLEAEIERKILWRETIARESGRKDLVTGLNVEIEKLGKRWFKRYDEDLSSFFPTEERMVTYMTWLQKTGVRRFVFYATDETGVTPEQREIVGSYVHSQFITQQEPINLERIARESNFLHTIGEEMRRMAGPIVVRNAAPKDIFGDDNFAKMYELFEALLRRSTFAFLESIPPASYELDTRKPGPGRLNKLEAELYRLYWWMHVHHPAPGSTTDTALTYIHSLIRREEVLDAWTAGVEDEKFFPVKKMRDWVSELKGTQPTLLRSVWISYPEVHGPAEKAGLLDKVRQILLRLR